MEEFISANDCCTHYNIELSFIDSLHSFGLLEIITIEEENFISVNDLNMLEKLIRLHYDLNINFEGIEAVSNLLQRVENMQREILSLTQRLHLYE